MTLIDLTATAVTPLLTPVLTGVRPRWMRRLSHTLLVWGILALPLVMFAQERSGLWAQEIERRVRTLEEWRELHRDLLAVQNITNAQNAESIRKLADIAEDHEKRLTIVVNTGETMIQVGTFAILSVPILAALMNALFNWFMFKRQERRNGNGNGINGSRPTH